MRQSSIFSNETIQRISIDEFHSFIAGFDASAAKVLATERNVHDVVQVHNILYEETLRTTQIYAHNKSKATLTYLWV